MRANCRVSASGPISASHSGSTTNSPTSPESSTRDQKLPVGTQRLHVRVQCAQVAGRLLQRDQVEARRDLGNRPQGPPVTLGAVITVSPPRLNQRAEVLNVPGRDEQVGHKRALVQHMGIEPGTQRRLFGTHGSGCGGVMEGRQCVGHGGQYRAGALSTLDRCRAGARGSAHGPKASVAPRWTKALHPRGLQDISGPTVDSCTYR